MFGHDEFGVGLSYSTAHMMKDLAEKETLTETEKFGILLTVSHSVEDIMSAMSIKKRFEGRR